MEAVCVTITPCQKEAIQKLATERQIKFSDALRRILDHALDSKRKAQ